MKLSSTGWKRSPHDGGAALVSAVAVAIIGIAITLVVVSQAIIVTNDSARDRIRTLGVHSAESALDATMSELATSAPCPGPDWSGLTVGTGSTATVVDVVIEYKKLGVTLTCTGGVLSGVPDEATVTTTSRPATPLPGGLQPERRFEANVNLIPLSSMIPGSALFSATGFGTSDGFQVHVDESTGAAGVWIDKGNFECRSMIIDGSLFVVDGSIVTKDGCEIKGDLWVKNGYNNCCTLNSGLRVHGDLTVRAGNLTLNGATRVGGAIRVSGSVPPANDGHWINSFKGTSQCASNLPTQCTDFVDYAPKGMPQVGFVIGDWQPAEDGTNFQLKHKADFAQAVLSSWGLGSAPNWEQQQVLGSPCSPPAWKSTTPVKLPLNGANTPTVYDMRDCGTFRTDSKMTIKLYADVAIFAGGFSNGGQFVVESGDNQPHRIWFIVPWSSGDDGTGPSNITVNGVNVPNFRPGDIQTQTGWKMTAPISAFLYTPKTVHYNTASTTHGQVYAGYFQGGGGVGQLYYNNIGVPGVNLTIPTGSAQGFTVEIVSKRELKN